MEVPNISAASISADKQAQYIQEAQVAVAKKKNEQPEIAGQLIQSAAQSAPEPGKGGRLDLKV